MKGRVNGFVSADIFTPRRLELKMAIDWNDPLLGVEYTPEEADFFDKYFGGRHAEKRAREALLPVGEEEEDEEEEDEDEEDEEEE